MTVVYHEDLEKDNENYNKYQAVNAIAQRARHLNTQGLPTGTVGVRQKLVIIATQELVDGAITYEKGTAKAPPVGLSSMFEELMKTQTRMTGAMAFSKKITSPRKMNRKMSNRKKGFSGTDACRKSCRRNSV